MNNKENENLNKNSIKKSNNSTILIPENKQKQEILNEIKQQENLIKDIKVNKHQVNPYLNKIGWICAFCSFLLGYTTGVINGALPFMVDDLKLSPTIIGLVTSSLLIGSAFGSLIAGRLADIFGRKITLMGNTILFIIGTFCYSFSPNSQCLISFRILLGLTIGGFSSVVSVLLAEFSTPECRPRMVTRSFLLLMIGEFGAFIANAVLGILWNEESSIWRWMCILSILPAIFELLLIFWLMPESPRWLVSVGKNSEAKTILHKIRFKSDEADNELTEIEEIKKLEENKGKGGFSFLIEMFGKFRRSLFVGIGIGLSMSSEGGGIIMYYATLMLRDNNGGDTDAALLGNTINGLISLIASAIGLLIISKMPRRRMYLFGVFGSIIPHSITVLLCFLLKNGPLKGWLILSSMLLFLILQQGAIMTVGSLLLTEIFPLRVRGLGVGISLWFAWMNNFLTSFLFPMAVDAFGYSISFIIIIFLCFIIGIFILICVPETQGKSLEKLEMEMKEEYKNSDESINEKQKSELKN
ncbi:MFS domain-containing protein [Meloidogyne graminicola]|uniref:MFS domain-containing protein n=1 Tax=Meloidogyne graminicola TaxID=189291 RepID=A0A8S9ZSQ6_9BILA|nr:MFS domain-containing protein [Meloidogyne graminicola]